MTFILAYGIAAVVVFVLLWPVFVGLSVYDVMTER